MEENQNLTAVLHEIAAKQNLQNYDIKITPCSSGGANYTSHLYTIVISSQERKLHMFAKVAALGEKLRGEFVMNLYDTEKFIYTELSDTFKQLEDKHDLAKEHRLHIAKYYGGNAKRLEEITVFEDLAHRGFKTYDRMKSITWAYGSAVCTELAKLHSLSMALECENPEKFKETVEYLKFDLSQMDSEASRNMLEKSKEMAVNAVREENRDRFEKVIQSMDMIAFAKFNRPIKRELLIHGDFRVSNIMHRDREDGSVEVIPVDYQTIRGGCPLVDLYYFIFTGTDGKFRAQYYDKLVEHYYSELRAALTRLGVDPDDVYSREDFEYELKELLPYGLLVAVFTLPIVTVEAENAPKVDQNMDFSDFNIEPGKLFAQRLNEIVDDYIRWGAL